MYNSLQCGHRAIFGRATRTADRKLKLATTNVTEGHICTVTRRGFSGGHTRGVYQADGATLIASLVDSTNNDFIYDASAALWFQK